MFSLYVCVYTHVCVCVRERERGKNKESEREKGGREGATIWTLIGHDSVSCSALIFERAFVVEVFFSQKSNFFPDFSHAFCQGNKSLS